MTADVVRMMKVGDRRVQVLRAGEVARLWGVSRQRVYQLMDQYDGTFPLPVARTEKGALWEREAIEEWLRSWDRRWDPNRGRAPSQNPGELLMTLAGGDYERVPSASVFPSIAGLQLLDRLVPWSDITQVRRLRDGDEPWQFAVRRTPYGIEFRAQVSVALYPDVATVPQQLRAEARAALRTARMPSWVFREE